MEGRGEVETYFIITLKSPVRHKQRDNKKKEWQNLHFLRNKQADNSFLHLTPSGQIQSTFKVLNKVKEIRKVYL